MCAFQFAADFSEFFGTRVLASVARKNKPIGFVPKLRKPTSIIGAFRKAINQVAYLEPNSAIPHVRFVETMDLSAQARAQALIEK